jgi:hypothetical protein
MAGVGVTGSAAKPDAWNGGRPLVADVELSTLYRGKARPEERSEEPAAAATTQKNAAPRIRTRMVKDYAGTFVCPRSKVAVFRPLRDAQRNGSFSDRCMRASVGGFKRDHRFYLQGSYDVRRQKSVGRESGDTINKPAIHCGRRNVQRYVVLPGGVTTSRCR